MYLAFNVHSTTLMFFIRYKIGIAACAAILLCFIF